MPPIRVRACAGTRQPIGNQRRSAPCDWLPTPSPTRPAIPKAASAACITSVPARAAACRRILDRWIGQFLQAGGKSAKSAAKIESRSVRGLKITTVDVSGAYSGMGGPMAQPGKPVPGYRLLGAIVEGTQGSVFFKFTGPAQTVAQNQTAFSKMLDSLSPQ